MREPCLEVAPQRSILRRYDGAERHRLGKPVDLRDVLLKRAPELRLAHFADQIVVSAVAQRADQLEAIARRNVYFGRAGKRVEQHAVRPGALEAGRNQYFSLADARNQLETLLLPNLVRFPLAREQNIGRMINGDGRGRGDLRRMVRKRGHDIRPTVGQHGVVLGRALAPHDLQLDA